MRKFDPHREWYQVFGVSGVHREQGGVLFNNAGKPVVIRDGMAVPLNDKSEPEPAAVTPEGMSLKELRDMAKVYEVEGYEKMSADELKNALGAE